MFPNRLIREKSPYLLQHAHNPVDWYTWGDEAFAKARAENKPVFLSVGYATCHWCHVMEKESFEDSEAAGYLNDIFVCIKVDREERPDIDAVYMAVCHLMNRTGGWPLTVLMTPDKKPFFAATYLPKTSRFGRMGLIELCQGVKKLWTSQKDNILNSAKRIADALQDSFAFSAAEVPGCSVSDQAYSQLEQAFDDRFGGFDAAPKFPTPHRLLFLLRYFHLSGKPQALNMIKKTLTAMRLGGIWDHVGFGFHRYSTDKQWLLPHFEKMLYDQALLAMSYLEAFQITQEPFFAKTAGDIFTYLMRDMTSEQGGFFTAEDADSEGEEGKFYVWTLEAFREILGEESQLFEKIFNLTQDGNFSEEASQKKSGANILHLDMSLSQQAEKQGLEQAELAARWENARKKLFESRESRIHPLKDDKVLTDWNGLMIAALSMGARILDKPEYTTAAQKAARFLLTEMKDSSGGLLHRFREGEAAIPATANDYAFLIRGLLELYRSLFDPGDLEQAICLQEQMLAKYWDEKNGGFFLTAAEHHELPARPKEIYDGALPSANSVSLLNLLHLSRLTGNMKWENRAFELARAFSGTVSSYPSAYTYFLLGTDFISGKAREVVIVGDPDAADTHAMLAALNRRFAPNQVVLLKTPQNAEKLAELTEFTAELKSVDGKATAYICTNFSCSSPVTEVEKLL
ncbi:MAG: thioredoxin domain-containing protein [Desulfobacteraceae bacterium IS3]|nr:MAG: thioredoxin domain-containing protein [Desulfobacteraceae bacterium IS3]